MRKTCFIQWWLPVIALVCIFHTAAAQQTAWYKVLSGKIGYRDATLYLCHGKHSMTGYLWVSQHYQPLEIFYQEALQPADSVVLSADGGKLHIELRGVMLTTGRYTGKANITVGDGGARSSAFQLLPRADSLVTAMAYHVAAATALLPSSLNNPSTYQYFTGLVWPAGAHAAAAASRQYVHTWLRMPPNAKPATWLEADKNNTIAAWRNQYMKMKPAEVAQMGLSLSVESTRRVMVLHEDQRLLTLAYYHFAHTGGAHGMYQTRLANIDKKTGKNIPLSAVFTTRGRTLLPHILDRAARQQFGIRNNLPLSKNGFTTDKIGLTDNFYITSDGFGFLYAPYQIRPFSDGEVHLFLPKKAMMSYLQPAFK